MNDAQIDRILDGIDKVAEKLGVAADFVMEALMKQVYLNGATYILIATIALGIAITFLVKGSKIAKQNDAIAIERNQIVRNKSQTRGYWSMSDELQNENFGQTFVWITSGLLFLISVWLYIPGIHRLINPEYFAMLKFMNLLQSI